MSFSSRISIPERLLVQHEPFQRLVDNRGVKMRRLRSISHERIGLMAESGMWFMRYGLGLALSVCLASISLAQRKSGQVKIEVTDQAGAGLEVSIKLRISPMAPRFRPALRRSHPNNLEFGRYRSRSPEWLRNPLLSDRGKIRTVISRSISLPLAATSDRVDVISTTPLAA
jgi:hypothetical protein